jgi:hypothetical protein
MLSALVAIEIFSRLSQMLSVLLTTAKASRLCTFYDDVHG